MTRERPPLFGAAGLTRRHSAMLLPMALVMAAGLSGCRPHTGSIAHAPSAPVSEAASRGGADTAEPEREGMERLWTRGTDDVPVIMYHDVVPRKEVWFDLTTRDFEAQMAALRAAGANVIPLSDVVAHLRDGKPLPERAIALTFDDGTLGDYTNALPILRRFNFPATFFVHTGYVGRKSEKDHMTWDQLREVQESGLVDVQPHTVTHPEDLRTMSDEAIRKELADSNAAIQNELGHAPRFFAYPSGHGDERVAQLVAEAGYEAAWNEIRAWDASPADRLHLPRFAPFRLDEILEHWRSPKPEGTPAPASIIVDARDSGSYNSAGTGTLDYQVGKWPEVRSEGGRLTLISAAVGAPGKGGSDLGGLRGGDVLLGSEEFSPMPDDRQHSSIGRPILIASDNQVMIARYQPWMGMERPALEVLLPGANLAVIGDDWLLHEGELQAATGPRRVRRATLLGVTADGRPFVARSSRNATVESLSAALIRMGAREAVLL